MPDKKSSYVLGKSGEEIALRYLKGKRYKIIAKNFRFFRGEIDIIAYDRATLVFVEVKTRKSKDFGFPEESVTVAKQKQIRKIARGFLLQNKIQGVACRFDVISLFFNENNNYSLRHIKNAF